MKKYLPSFLLILMFGALTVNAQNYSFRSDKFQHVKQGTFYPKNYERGFAVQLINLEAPAPGGESYRSFLMRVKAESAKRFPRRSVPQSKSIQSSEPDLIKVNDFGMYRYYPNQDTLVPAGGGRPLDNTMAVSNNGLLLGSVNSMLYGYDLAGDSLLFNPPIEFTDFAGLPGSSFPFDPKLLYDPQEDRFIFVFLSGRTSIDSKITVAFSQTNNPLDGWNIYSIDGNPRKDTTWTDYPAIAITDKELFITINLLREGEPWQTGFAGSVIWQVNKFDGYLGKDTLNDRLWSDIRYGGKYIRNLCPVQGGKSPSGPNMHLLSNRNFSVMNDSIFMVEVTNTIDDSSTTLKVKLGITNEPYGAPPNGEQENANPVTDSTGFDTNDGRVLGGFLHDNRLQFVANTKNFETGMAAVYHGFIDSLSSENIVVTGNVIGDSELDFGYPNIAYSGKADCDHEAIIAFDHTSAEVYSGISAIHYTNANTYSDVISLKEGEGFVDMITGPYERWGDYFGIQRLYTEPGKVWTAGFYGLKNNRSNTWFNQLQSPDSTIMSLEVDTNILSDNECDGELSITVSGGHEPYSYTWNNEPTTSGNFPVNTCEDEYEFVVTDKYGCKISAIGKFDHSESELLGIFPNPVSDRVNLKFRFDTDKAVVVQLHNAKGQMIGELLNQNVKKGLNSFSFSTYSLSAGIYFLTIYNGDKQILNEKLIKN